MWTRRVSIGCRGDAVRRPGTVVHAGPTSPNMSAVSTPHPMGDPPGRPYIAHQEGFARWSEGTNAATCSQ